MHTQGQTLAELRANLARVRRAEIAEAARERRLRKEQASPLRAMLRNAASASATDAHLSLASAPDAGAGTLGSGRSLATDYGGAASTPSSPPDAGSFRAPPVWQEAGEMLLNEDSLIAAALGVPVGTVRSSAAAFPAEPHTPAPSPLSSAPGTDAASIPGNSLPAAWYNPPPVVPAAVTRSAVDASSLLLPDEEPGSAPGFSAQDKYSARSRLLGAAGGHRRLRSEAYSAPRPPTRPRVSPPHPAQPEVTETAEHGAEPRLGPGLRRSRLRPASAGAVMGRRDPSSLTPDEDGGVEQRRVPTSQDFAVGAMQLRIASQMLRVVNSSQAMKESLAEDVADLLHLIATAQAPSRSRYLGEAYTNVAPGRLELPQLDSSTSPSASSPGSQGPASAASTTPASSQLGGSVHPSVSAPRGRASSLRRGNRSDTSQQGGSPSWTTLAYAVSPLRDERMWDTLADEVEGRGRGDHRQEQPPAEVPHHQVDRGEEQRKEAYPSYAGPRAGGFRGNRGDDRLHHTRSQGTTLSQARRGEAADSIVSVGTATSPPPLVVGISLIELVEGVVNDVNISALTKGSGSDSPPRERQRPRRAEQIGSGNGRYTSAPNRGWRGGNEAPRRGKRGQERSGTLDMPEARREEGLLLHSKRSLEEQRGSNGGSKLERVDTATTTQQGTTPAIEPLRVSVSVAAMEEDDASELDGSSTDDDGGRSGSFSVQSGSVGQTRGRSGTQDAASTHNDEAGSRATSPLPPPLEQSAAPAPDPAKESVAGADSLQSRSKASGEAMRRIAGRENEPGHGLHSPHEERVVEEKGHEAGAALAEPDEVLPDGEISLQGRTNGVFGAAGDAVAVNGAVPVQITVSPPSGRGTDTLASLGGGFPPREGALAPTPPAVHGHGRSPSDGTGAAVRARTPSPNTASQSTLLSEARKSPTPPAERRNSRDWQASPKTLSPSPSQPSLGHSRNFSSTFSAEFAEFVDYSDSDITASVYEGEEDSVLGGGGRHSAASDSGSENRSSEVAYI